MFYEQISWHVNKLIVVEYILIRLITPPSFWKRMGR